MDKTSLLYHTNNYRKSHLLRLSRDAPLDVYLIMCCHGVLLEPSMLLFGRQPLYFSHWVY